MSKPKTYVLASDIHYPHHDSPSIAAFFDFVTRNKATIDGIVLMGDMLDFAEIAHHTSGKPLHRERGSLMRNIEGFDHEILTRLEKLLPGKEKVFILGNHERFLEADLIETQPELEGAISIERLLRLKARGWKVIPLGGSFHKLGHLHVLHGDVITGGIHHTKRAVETWACNVVYGHYHSLSSFTKCAASHESRKWTAWSIPTLGTVRPGYLRGKGNAHIHGFAICYVRTNDDFNLYPVTIVEGRFSYGGEDYGDEKGIKGRTGKANRTKNRRPSAMPKSVSAKAGSKGKT
jgi:hypothetical protein